MSTRNEIFSAYALSITDLIDTIESETTSAQSSKELGDWGDSLQGLINAMFGVEAVIIETLVLLSQLLLVEPDEIMYEWLLTANTKVTEIAKDHNA